MRIIITYYICEFLMCPANEIAQCVVKLKWKWARVVVDGGYGV